MDEKFALMAIIVKDKSEIQTVNAVLSEHSDIILSRSGLPFKDRGVSIISLVLTAPADRINKFAGRLGTINGIKIKTLQTEID